jgi:hypothetical protein
MKKIVLSILATVMVGNVAFSQGQLMLQNSSGGTTKIYTTDTVNGQSTGQIGSLIAGNATTLYTFALFVSSTVNASGGVPSALSPAATPWTASGWYFTGDYANNTALAGRILGADNGGSYAAIAAGTVSGVSLVAGVNANVELIGWNTAIGGTTLSSFETAYNNHVAGLYYGYSGVANNTLGDSGATVNNSSIFVSPSLGGITGFTLAPVAPVPEPCTMALLGLGGLSLLAIRRRK